METPTDWSINVLPFRLIPCDFGHPIDNKLLKDIIEYFKASSEWIILFEAKNTNIEKEILVARSRKANGLYLHIYPDGVGIFTLIDKKEIHISYKDYKPEETMRTRKIAHQKILTHQHELSQFLDDHIANIRSLFNPNLKRPSASSEWENKGLSYVMSFYFIDVDIKAINDPDFQRKLVTLLFPYYVEGNEYPLMIDKEMYKEELIGDFLLLVKQNHEMLPFVHTCASWSNFLIIGRITEKLREEYWKLQRDFQRVWFYTYITDKFIEYSLKNISAITPDTELERLYNILTDMMFKINRYESIASSTAHERDFRLYHALKTSSRLDSLIASVEKKAKLFRDRCNWLLEEKRTKADKRIQFILFLIAIISIVGGYKSFIDLGLFSLLFVFLAILIGLYLFKPFLFIKKRKTP